MNPHTCTALTAGCYRCDLNRDETQAYIDSLKVTTHGVVHDPDCHHVSGPCSSADRWYPQDGDHACKRCLPNGLPAPVTLSASTTEEDQ